MKKKNPQDATLRNVRAQKKQIAALKAKVKVLNKWVGWLVREYGKGRSPKYKARLKKMWARAR